MRGGSDRMELRELDSEGNVKLDHDDEFEGQFEDVLGNHTGGYAHNNIYNPQPGCKYWHGKGNSQTGRARIRALIQQGAEIVKDDDEERRGDGSDLDLSGSSLDSTLGDSEMVTLRFREPVYRRIQAEKAEMAQRQIEAQTSGDDFLGRDKISGTNLAPNKDVYHRKTEHGLTFGDNVDF